MFKPTEVTSTAPTVNDDFSAGYHEGDLWWDTSTSIFYVCVDNAEGAADWDEIGSSDVGSWATWSPSYTWTGNTPTGLTTVARYMLIGSLCVFTLDVDGTTGGAGNLTDFEFSLPQQVVDNDNYIPVSAIYNDNGSYGKNLALIDGASAASGDRKVKHVSFHTIGTTTAFRLYFRGFYEYELAP